MLFAVFSSLVRNWRDTKSVLSFFEWEEKEKRTKIFYLLIRYKVKYDIILMNNAIHISDMKWYFDLILCSIFY